MVSKKLCLICDETKLLSDFYKRAENKIDGRRNSCKKCENVAKLRYRKNNKKKIRESNKKCHEKNKEKYKESSKKYYSENKDKIKKKNEEYRLKNKKKRNDRERHNREDNGEKIRKYHREYRQKNIDKMLQYHKEYRKENLEKMRKYHVEYNRERKENDINFRLTHTLGDRLRSAIKSSGVKKNTKTINLIGCDIPFLKKYLEALFKPGMSWENHGRSGWHIDHIYPCASFDLTNPRQQKICFHYSNLQPLWAKENIRKGKKLAGDGD